jgi:acyl-CoA dehydrogenase
MNCSAPDTGNMEVLAKYGTEEQKKQWLQPLLDGKIRSAFLMTEPAVASSDARNISMSMVKDGDHYILNGRKWWSSGAGDPRCKIYIVMAKSNPDAPHPFLQQSVILVPAGYPGVTVKRMLSVFGYDDAPHGHAEIVFDNVRIHESNIVLGEGRGFEIIQGRLGPGRIHHAMRAVGAAERALEFMIARVNDPTRKTFGNTLNKHGVILEWIARSRMEVDAARLMVLNAAVKIDVTNAKQAQKEIGLAKVFVPSISLAVVDRAIQAFGAAGVSQDTPLAMIWAHQRTLRLADGPDEVHLWQIGRNEAKRGPELQEKITQQKDRAESLLKAKGLASNL